MNIDAEFEDFIELLNRHSVEYMVVGGYELAFHGNNNYIGASIKAD